MSGTDEMELFNHHFNRSTLCSQLIMIGRKNILGSSKSELMDRQVIIATNFWGNTKNVNKIVE